MNDTSHLPAPAAGSSFLGKQYRMLADVSTAAIFEYDLEAGKFSLLLNTAQHFGLSESELAAFISSRAYTSLAALLGDFIHKDDLATALETHAQLPSNRFVRYMARLKQADKTYVWRNIYYSTTVDEENKPRHLYGYVADIHNSNVQSGMMERFVHAVDHCFLCLDINTDSYTLFGSHNGHSYVLAVGSNYTRSVVNYTNTYVVPDDREKCLAQMQISNFIEVLQAKGHHAFSIDVRDPVLGNTRKVLKYSYYEKEHGLVLVTVDDKAHQYADEQECTKIIQEAISQATTDHLTGLYNRHSGEELIKKALATNAGAHHALMLLDIGHFERARKRGGDLFGESLLADVALRLKRLFRNNDVLARVGETRFMGFMTDVEDETVAVRKTEDIRRILRETCVDLQNQPVLECSVGLVFIKGRPCFETLLNNAQQSLQMAMQAGDNTFHIHQESIPVVCPMPVVQEQESNQAFSVLQLKERIFEILYSTPDFAQSINLALAFIGGMFDMSRVYVFENSAGGQTTSNTFEWCNESTNSEIDNLQNMPFASVGYPDLFDASGLFNCPDIFTTHGVMREILAVQGICSLLQVAIKENDEVTGFVGFDECRMPRTFTAAEISTLSFAARIIGTFVRKKRMTELSNTAVHDKVEALDNLPCYIYVIDKDHRLHYMNKMVNMLVPSALVGMKCHSVLKGLDDPCPGCPAIRCENGRCSVEMYNPRYNLWVISSAAQITWAERKNMVLVSCQDITSFKIMRSMS